MIRRAAYLTTCLIIVLTMGCTARRHLQSGDAAWDVGDMNSAAYHYERALDHRESLHRDSEFLSRLAYAQARVAYDTAVRLREQGEFVSAVQQLRLAMDKDPSYSEPARLLPAVLAEAARKFYDDALSAADRGDLDAAGEQLGRAEQYDPDNAQVRFAIASLSPGTLPGDTPGLAQYRAGVSQSAERDWGNAKQSMQESVGLNPGLLPARAGLKQATDRERAALHEMRNVEFLLQQRNMGQAIADLNRSLLIWPTNRQAQRYLAQAQEQRGLAVERFNAASQSAANGQWDLAMAQAQSGYDIDISYGPLNVLRRDLPTRAAAYYTRQGDGHLGGAQLDAAFAAYHRAFDYAEGYEDARRGLALVYTAWGSELEGDGRIGAAYLHYVRASDTYNASELNENTNRVRLAIEQRIGMDIGYSVAGDGRGVVAPQQIGDAIRHRLGSLGTAASGDGVAPYMIETTISDIRIDQQIIGSSDRNHRYTTRELRHNDEYDRVANDLQREQEHLSRARHELHAVRCHGHHNGAPCDCFSGAHYHGLESDVRRHERIVHDLADRLRRTPHQIEVSISHSWPYTVETHRKTGSLVTVSRLIDTANATVISQGEHRSSFSARDEQVLNPNPSIGLGYDRLILPSDAQVAAEMADEIGDDAARWATTLAVRYRVDQLIEQAASLEQAGNPAGALEARVDAVVVRRSAQVDTREAQEELENMVQQHTR